MGVVGKDTAGGALKGAAVGASVGSIVPGIGTAIGAAAGAVVGGVVGFISGKNKQKKLRALKKASERPVLEMPKGIGTNVKMYEMLSNSTRMPGQSAIEDRIGANTAASVNNLQQYATDSTQLISGLGQIQQNKNAATQNLGIEAAQLNLTAKDRLAGARETYADYENMIFNYNKNQPYLMALAEKRRIEDQAQQNLQNGLQSFTNAAGAVGGSMGGMSGGSGGQSMWGGFGGSGGSAPQMRGRAN